MKCCIDTIAIYKLLPVGINIINTHAGWKYFKQKNSFDNHYFIRQDGITCRYYPDRYGNGQIWITCSIPKLLARNNLFPIEGLGIDAMFYYKVSSILVNILLPPRALIARGIREPNILLDISSWQVSRLDLFMLHRIDINQREWYMQAYSRLSLGAYVPYKFGNTFYLNSSLKKHKAAGTVVRVYPKLREMQDAQSTPEHINNDCDYYMELCDRMDDYIRFEFQFRRQTLRYYFNNAKSVTLSDVMNERFQMERMAHMIKRLRLSDKIISRKKMKGCIDVIFTKEPTKQRALNYIAMVNKRGSYPNTIKSSFSTGQVRYIRDRLHKYGFHVIVSDFKSLEPVNLDNCPYIQL